MRIEQKNYNHYEFDTSILNPVCDQDGYLKSIGLGAQNQCECAYTGKRSLSWFFWIPVISGGWRDSFLDRNNLELSHEHIFFSGSGENLGWGEKGFFNESSGENGYTIDQKCFDGSIIRKAISSISSSDRYGFIKNNCQDFIDRVRRFYQAMEFEKNKNAVGN